MDSSLNANSQAGPRRVLLVGCGDLGLRVAARLSTQGWEPWGLRRQPPAAPLAGLRWLAGDVTRPEPPAAWPAGDWAGIVYLPSPDQREETAYRRVFLDGPRHLRAWLGPASPGRLLFVSSSAVYGEHAGAWVDETTPPAPLGFNGRILLQAEQQLAADWSQPVVLRLAGLYGPGREAWLARLRAGQLRVPRQPAHWCNRIHVDDAAAAIVHLWALPQPQRLYVGVDDTPLRLDELYGQVAAWLGLPTPAEGPPPAAVGNKRLSNARLRGSGFVPHWPDAREGYWQVVLSGGL